MQMWNAAAQLKEERWT